ncbi:5-formyltetrahydrofolate cyclo-ligase [Erysipelotrichaceae bacterium]|nr:5-formyltetrahydrofolate cyclo-ligase [Erysipelotrichaceae bacterium]
MNKKNLRRAYITKRLQRRTQEPISAVEHAIFKQLEKLDAFKKATSIGVCIPFKGEVDIMRYLGIQKLAYAAILDDGTMHFYLNATIFVKTKIGVLAPDLNQKGLIEIIPSILIIPAIAINYTGYRLGYGGGYFDRYLAKNKIISIGIIEDQDLINIKFEQEYDIKLTHVLTEKRSLTF